MLVRDFHPRDRLALRELYLRSRRDAFIWLDATRFALADFDRDTEGEIVWVAVDESETPIGFLSVWAPDNFIHNLFVASQHLRRGIGSALLAHCVAAIGRPARLKCSKANSDARVFYESRGWRTVSEDEGPDGRYYLMEFDEPVVTNSH